MWFWQRREVYMGKDGPQLYAVRTALEQAGIGFECIVRSGRNYTGADRRMTNAHSADAASGMFMCAARIWKPPRVWHSARCGAAER